MNVLQFLPALFVALCLASAAPELRDTFSCPEIDIDFMGSDIDTVHNIGSWKDCGKQLKLVSGTQNNKQGKVFFFLRERVWLDGMGVSLDFMKKEFKLELIVKIG